MCAAALLLALEKSQKYQGFLQKSYLTLLPQDFLIPTEYCSWLGPADAETGRHRFPSNISTVGDSWAGDKKTLPGAKGTSL